MDEPLRDREPSCAVSSGWIGQHDRSGSGLAIPILQMASVQPPIGPATVPVPVESSAELGAPSPSYRGLQVEIHSDHLST